MPVYYTQKHSLLEPCVVWTFKYTENACSKLGVCYIVGNGKEPTLLGRIERAEHRVVSCDQRGRSPTAVNLSFLYRSRKFSFK
jgi:hypothetical protein